MTPAQVVVVGDVMVDYHLDVAPGPDEKVEVVRSSRVLGGTGANVTAVIAALGHRPQFVAAVGDDPAGRWLVEQLGAAGLDATGVITVPGYSGQSTIVHRGEHREVFVDKGVVLDVATPSLARFDDPLVFVNYAPHVVVDLVQAEHGERVIAGFEEWMAQTPGLLEVLAHTRLVVTNAAGFERLKHEASVDTMRLVVTHGADGVVIRTPGSEPVAMPASPVNAIDTTGAGDCFAGVLVTALAEGVALADAVASAIVGAAISTTAVGAQGRLPTRAEVGLAPVSGHGAER